jgi:hypothetical protein
VAQSALPKSKINTDITQPARQRAGRKASVGKKRGGSRGQGRISGDTRDSVRGGTREVIEMELGITVYPPKADGEPWRAVFAENGQRRNRQAVTEAELAASPAGPPRHAAATTAHPAWPSRADATPQNTAYRHPAASAASAAAANSTRSSSPDRGTQPDIGEEHPACRHGKEIRDVLPPSAGGLRPQPERLRHHVQCPADEVQRQQAPLLLQALEPVTTPRRHQELQTRPVTLPGPPGEMTPRHATPATTSPRSRTGASARVPPLRQETSHRASHPAPHASSRRASSGSLKTSARSPTLHNADGIRPAATAGIPDIYCKSCPVMRKRASALLARRVAPAR